MFTITKFNIIYNYIIILICKMMHKFTFFV